MQTPTFRLEQVVRSSHEAMEDFEGPLDLILHLLSKNKIEIRDIKISVLLQQYIAYLEQMKSMDMEIASDFIAMASHLVYIKSRMLLSVTDDETREEMDLLMQALEERRRQEEYQRIAEGRHFLSERADTGRDIYARLPERLEADPAYTYSHDAAVLARALRDMTARFERSLPPMAKSFSHIVGREPYSVDDMIAVIVGRLRKRGTGYFSSLLALGQNRSEQVALFLALLELCRCHRLTVTEQGDDYTLDLLIEE